VELVSKKYTQTNKQATKFRRKSKAGIHLVL